MKNKYNLLVYFLVLVCLSEAGYRVYKAYQSIKNQQEKSNGIH
jgi:hypothetical protein